MTDNAIKAVAKGQNSRRFLYYLLKTLQLNGRQSGSGQPLINQSALSTIKVRVPTASNQSTIAHILGTLDDKIELNRRKNETLEAMAQAIFKNWFVDFGPTRAKMEGRAPYLPPEIWDLFPDALDDEGKPEGWEVRNLGDLFNVTIGRTPPRKEQQHFLPCGRGRTWLSIKAMGDIQTFAMKSEEDLTKAAVRQYRIPVVPEGTVLVSFKLTVGRVAIAVKEMHTNEAIAHLGSGNSTPVSNWFTYCFMKNFDYRTLASTSSIATAVNSRSIRGIRMVVPQTEIHAAFKSIAEPLFMRILGNLIEFRALVQTRDTLLPKLISGEVRFGDAAKSVNFVADQPAGDSAPR